MAIQRNQNKISQAGKPWIFFSAALISVVGSSITVISSTHKSRHLIFELNQLENRRNELQVEWGQLLLEESSLVSQGRVEDIAIAELGMEIPVLEKIVVVRRE